tara:strand:+ start:235 stop:678 length:444 start_codon:yes stop_codon:yes gene_type:complete
MTNITGKNPWILKKIVLPQHTDHAGVMWHGSYLNWLEEARINALLNVGLSYADLSKICYELPVVDLKIKYINSCHHGEEILLKSWALDSKGIRLPWKTIFFKSDQTIAAEANVNLVLLRKIESGISVIRNKPKFISNFIDKLIIGPE